MRAKNTLTKVKDPQLEAALKKAGSAKVLAASIGITPQAITRWIRNGNNPTPANRAKLQVFCETKKTDVKEDAKKLLSLVFGEASKKSEVKVIGRAVWIKASFYEDKISQLCKKIISDDHN